MADDQPVKEQAPVPKVRFEDFWGEDARLVQAKVEATCMLALPDRFLRGPLARIVARNKGKDSMEAVQAFCRDAGLAWYERYRERKGRATPERRDEILALVPTPHVGEPMGRVLVDLSKDIRAEPFGRVLATRFRASPQGRSMAMREAILEALLEARGA